jgi:transcriptional regulator GlxA family with amidase domain
MNGLTVTAQMTLEDLPDADAVLVGSGMRTREYAADPRFLSTLRLDPTRQLIGSQCSGALLLAKLGLLDGSRSSPPATWRPPAAASRASTSLPG